MTEPFSYRYCMAQLAARVTFDVTRQFLAVLPGRVVHNFNSASARTRSPAATVDVDPRLQVIRSIDALMREWLVMYIHNSQPQRHRQPARRPILHIRI
ncbi:hypothetical protein [Lysobacter sp. HA18]